MRSPSRPLRAAALGGLLAVALGLGLVGAWRSTFARVRDDARLAAWANRRPERLLISWREVRSPWPGRLEIEGLRVAGRTPRLRWEVTAERASGWLDPAPLLVRELRFTAIRIAGVRVRVEPDPAAGASPPAAPREPAIAGFPGPPPGPPPPRAHPWSFTFRDLAVEELTSVEAGEARFDGRARGRGGFRIRRRRDAEILPTAIAVDGLLLRHQGEELARGVGATLRFQVAPWRYRDARPADLLPRFAGQVDVEGSFVPSALTRHLTRAWPSLDLESGLAEVSARLLVRGGRLVDGSRLRIVSPDERLRFLGFEARGRATLAARVAGAAGSGRLESELTLDGWTLGRPGGPVQATGEGLRLVARSADTSLSEPPTGGELELDLGQARVPDLRLLNDYLPAAAGVEVERGSAAVTGRLRFRQASRDGEGTLAVRGRGLRLSARGQRLAGDLEADLRLSHPDLEALTFSLAGSRVALQRLSAETSEGGRIRDWWADAHLTAGTLDLRPPLALAGDFTAKLADTRPLIAFYEIRRDLSDWAERLLTLEGLSATGHFDWTAGRFALDQGYVPLNHGELRARLLVDRGSARGRLLARWRRLVVGVELLDGERSIRLRDVEEWYVRPATPARPD